MAEIREFRAKRTQETDSVEFKDKIKQYRKSSFIKRILIILVVAIFVVVLYSYAKNQTYSTMSTTKEVEYNKVENTRFLESNGKLVTYSKDGISCMDTKGNALWNLTYEMQSPIVHSKGTMVAVADYNGHIIYLIDEKGNTVQIDTNLPIRDYALDKNGSVAAILEDTGTAWINLYSKNGEKIAEAKATMTKTGYPMAVAVSGEVMGVSYFYADGKQMKSSVTFCNFGGIGENATDHIVSSYDYANAVVPIVEFLDGETIFAVADNRLMFYSGSKKPVGKADILLDEEIQGVYYGDGKVALIFYDTSGEGKYRMDVYTPDGKKQLSMIFDMDFKDIIIRNNQIMIYNEQQCCLYKMNGKVKYEGVFDGMAMYMIATDSPRKFILLEEDSLKSIEFK